jgi:hypothetical protein
MSVRKLHPFTYWHEQLNGLCDKLLIKGYLHEEAHKIARDFFLEHKEYTHLIICAEDVLVTPCHLKLLLQDIEEHPEFPVIAGYSNFDFTHNWLNITDLDLRRTYVMFAEQYRFIPPLSVMSGKYPTFMRVFFQGLALAAIRRDVVEKIPFRPYKRVSDRLGYNRGVMFDLAFAIDCANANIPQYVDTRLWLIHGGNTVHLVNFAEKEVKFIPREKNINLVYTSI